MYLCSEMAPPGDLFERQSFGETNIIADPQATIRLTLRHLRIFKNIYRIFKDIKKIEKKYCWSSGNNKINTETSKDIQKHLQNI